MEREIIERLIIDSVMGELNEDVKKLLAEYLADHPEAKTWSDEILEDYDLVALTLKTKTHDVKSTPTKPIAQKRMLLSNLNWQPVAKWAAMIMLAAFVGIGFSRWPKEKRTDIQSPTHQQSHNFSIKRFTSDTIDKDQGFWQTKALAFIESDKKKKQKPSKKNTNLWEMYKNAKENHHD
jgi:anti-sigma factor RsiW